MRLGKYNVQDQDCKIFFQSFSTEQSHQEVDSIENGFHNLESRIDSIFERLKASKESDSDVKTITTNLSLFKRYITTLKIALSPIPKGLTPTEIMGLPRQTARSKLVNDTTIELFMPGDTSYKKPFEQIHEAIGNLIRMEQTTSLTERDSISDTDLQILSTKQSVIARLEQLESGRRAVGGGMLTMKRPGTLAGLISTMGIGGQPNKNNVGLLEELNEEIYKIEDTFHTSITDHLSPV